MTKQSPNSRANTCCLNRLWALEEGEGGERGANGGGVGGGEGGSEGEIGQRGTQINVANQAGVAV